MVTRRNVDPTVAHERAVRAARARTSLDHHVEKVVENAGELNSDQLARLRALLPAVDEAASDG